MPEVVVSQPGSLALSRLRCGQLCVAGVPRGFGAKPAIKIVRKMRLSIASGERPIKALAALMSVVSNPSVNRAKTHGFYFNKRRWRIKRWARVRLLSRLG